MLRRIVLLGGLMTASCVLGGGIDIPSADLPGDGGIGLDGGNEGSMDGGLTEGPPTGDGAGDGGSPCCFKLSTAGLGGGAGLGGAGGGP